jgi:hypothetical protein
MTSPGQVGPLSFDLRTRGSIVVGPLGFLLLGSDPLQHCLVGSWSCLQYRFNVLPYDAGARRERATQGVSGRPGEARLMAA